MTHIIHKVPLEQFIDSLITVREMGAEFADLHITVDEQNEEDIIMVVTKPEYMVELEDDDEDEESPIQKKKDLTDDEIEGLI